MCRQISLPAQESCLNVAEDLSLTPGEWVRLLYNQPGSEAAAFLSRFPPERALHFPQQMRSETDSQARQGAKILVLPAADLSGLDDAGLVRAIRDGDPRAPRVLWDRHARLVYRILRRSLGRQDEVEDLVQEVFLSLWRRLPTLREPRALPAFLVTITTLTLRHEMRRRWVRRCMSLGTTQDIDHDPRVVHPNPEARQALSRFYAILDRLGHEERIAFVLRFIEGMELTEVAAAMGLSLATAKRRLAHARARVEHHIGRDPGLAAYLSGIDEESP
jgi:RNA polymerase sigma-70 factor (ECF subfamily)